MQAIQKQIDLFIGETVETIEPPLDNTLYRYGFALLPASYFFLNDLLYLLSLFMTVMVSSKGKLKGNYFVEEGGLFSINDLLSWKPSKSEDQVQFE